MDQFISFCKNNIFLIVTFILVAFIVSILIIITYLLKQLLCRKRGHDEHIVAASVLKHGTIDRITYFDSKLMPLPSSSALTPSENTNKQVQHDKEGNLGQHEQQKDSVEKPKSLLQETMSVRSSSGYERIWFETRTESSM